VVGYGTNTIATSSDNGNTWIGRIQNGGISTGYGVAYGLDGTGAGLWVAVGYSTTNTIATSSDNGNTWVGQTANGGLNTNATSAGVAYGNGLWVAVGTGSNSIATSTNGTAWMGVIKNGSLTTSGFGVAFKPLIQ
jgi:hypothetical protein